MTTTAAPADDRLLADCLFYIRTTDYVSFAELETWLAGRGIGTEGTFALEPFPNVFLWGGVSEEFCGIVERLRPHLDLKPASVLVYLADGKVPRLPLAKRPPRNGYKEPHWLPVTLRAKQRPTKDEIRRGLLDEARS
jgi:hypothetical protein